MQNNVCMERSITVVEIWVAVVGAASLVFAAIATGYWALKRALVDNGAAERAQYYSDIQTSLTDLQQRCTKLEKERNKLDAERSVEAAKAEGLLEQNKILKFTLESLKEQNRILLEAKRTLEKRLDDITAGAI